ncbi:hypothetical protein [Streptomyces sp. NPDC060065]|uniref:hypothetical protein n=1 Tax=Streptomyces sp. NPDC060065 TaxID=3347050 RepID=UPI00368AB30E
MATGVAVGEDAAEGQFVPTAVVGEAVDERRMADQAAGDVSQVAEDLREGDASALRDEFVVHVHSVDRCERP